MYTVDSIFLAATLIYLYADPTNHFEDVTRAVRLDGKRREFDLDVPEEDGKIYEAEYKNGTLAISDLRAWEQWYSRLVYLVKKIQQDGLTEWTAPPVPVRRSDQWWVDGRAAVEQRRKEREERERMSESLFQEPESQRLAPSSTQSRCP